MLRKILSYLLAAAASTSLLLVLPATGAVAVAATASATANRPVPLRSGETTRVYVDSTSDFRQVVQTRYDNFQFGEQIGRWTPAGWEIGYVNNTPNTCTWLLQLYYQANGVTQEWRGIGIYLASQYVGNIFLPPGTYLAKNGPMTGPNSCDLS